MARLPVLMYHNVSDDKKNSKGLTVSTEKLESHFHYLAANNFQSFHLSELEKLPQIPKKSIVITFDDVTVNQLAAVELLQKYNLKATFFVPFAYVGKTDEWNKGSEPIMSYEQLKKIPSNIELGFHSYAHLKYDTLSETEINEDFAKCFQRIEENGLQVHHSVAFPYGNYPKKEPQKSQFQQALKQNGIVMGLRIGNKINSYPFKNPYEIQRIDVKGEDSLLKFRAKLLFGKLRLF